MSSIKIPHLGALAGLAMGATLIAQPAQAAVVYSFEDDNDVTGSVSWDGSATSGAVASNISIATLFLNNGSPLGCTGCVLNLTTGIFSQTTGPVTIFGPGGTYTITGDLGNGNEVLASGVVGNSTFLNSPAGLDGTFSILDPSSVSQSVQDAYGQPFVAGPFFTGFAAVSFTNTSTTGFQSVNIAAVDAHLELLEVHEPRALALLGLGMLGIAASRRPHRRASQAEGS